MDGKAARGRWNAYEGGTHTKLFIDASILSTYDLRSEINLEQFGVIVFFALFCFSNKEGKQSVCFGALNKTVKEFFFVP